MSVLYWAHQLKRLVVVSTGLIGKSSRDEFVDFKSTYVPDCQCIITSLSSAFFSH